LLTALLHGQILAGFATALWASVAVAVTPLEVRGNQFVNPKTGAAFQVVGVAYQPGGSAGYDPARGFDPLSNPDRCLRDAALMQVLGINTIRVYNLSPDLNHDKCASIFNAVRWLETWATPGRHSRTD
jgi:1,3-beta-glucanosyltransferase GAS3